MVGGEVDYVKIIGDDIDLNYLNKTMTSLENELAKSLMYRVSLTDKEEDAIALAKEIAKDIKPFVREEFEVKKCNNEGNNRRPFNLEEYLKDPSKKVVTRDGHDARIVCIDRKADSYSKCTIVALVEDKEGCEKCFYFTKNGKYLDGFESTLDLFFAPEKKEGWINIYKTNPDNYGLRNYGLGSIYNSEEEAKNLMLPISDYVTTIKIEWEE